MATIAIQKLNEADELPVGTMIVVQDQRAREFDPEMDQLDHVIGVCYAKTNVSGRTFLRCDGPEFYWYDRIYWKEDLTYLPDETRGGIVMPNPQFGGWNPYSSDAFVCVATYGYAVVQSSYENIPPRWAVLDAGDDYTGVIIR